MINELGLKPIARLVNAASAGVHPRLMGIGPVEAVPKVLKQAGMTLADIDLIELNEAFASQSLAVIREAGLDATKININGGAIALGHPLGCTGCKLTIQILQDMKKRNDESTDIETREFAVLLYGEDHISNRFSTEASISSLTRADLAAFHDMYYYPANMTLAVSGSFTKAAMVKKLEDAFATWPSPKRVVAAIPSGIKPAAPGFYRISKDVNQGRVSVGLPSVLRTSPDVYALEVMNEILGGSGFTSRITKTVRSNEGLAYSAGSGIGFGTYFPGRFRAAYQSKSSTVAYALQLVFEEIRKIRETPVTDEELVTIKNNLIQTVPSNFESKAQQAGTFAADEYTKRDPLYWASYRDRIQAVTAADVQRVAKQYLVPEKMITLVVGNQAEIAKGDSKHDVTIEKIANGKVTELPLRDPMTMKRKKLLQLADHQGFEVAAFRHSESHRMVGGL